MIYLAAIFLPPLALLLCGKWFQAIINFVIYVLAWIGLITFLPGVLLWGVAVVHAILAINSHRADKRNRELIDAMRQNR